MKKVRAARAFLPLLFLAIAAPSSAVRPREGARSDAARFGLDRPQENRRRLDRSVLREAVRSFNRSHRRPRALSFGPQGVGPGAGSAPRRLADQVAREFLERHGPSLGLDASQLRLELARTSRDVHHLLFVQVVDGVPVEFSRVKVHLSEDGEILSLQSSFRPDVPSRAVPRVSRAAAAAAVALELGRVPPADAGVLVHVPPPGGAGTRLAWRLRASGPGGSWVYYVDAETGRVLLRYNDLRFQACQSSGTVTGEVFDIDPTETPMTVRSMRHETVYVADVTNPVLTNSAGFFCSAVPGRISTALQGPYANVAHFTGPNVHYDNGIGTWEVLSTPVSSPQPYPSGSVLISTIVAPADAIRVLPNFITFSVGGVDGSGDIVDNDQVAVLGPDGFPVATYIGNRGQFRGASVPGRTFRLRLTSNESGTAEGFSVNISSYLKADPALQGVTDNPSATFTWTTARTFDGSRDEINLFYHLNRMRDYFVTGDGSYAPGVNAGQSAFIDQPVPAMARIPDLANAYYDPLHGNLAFGAVGNGFALDASVVRHEYVHFMVDQIFPIVNLGQHGAISEAVADYFAASSLNQSSIGRFTNSVFGGVGALRDLDCQASPPCKVLPNDWQGLVHQDGLAVGQSLWEIRQALMQPANLGAAAGQACADGLAFEALFFFPDNFTDFLEAMLEVDRLGLLAACGGAGAWGPLITQRFSVHGIREVEAVADQDVYEPNDGIQSATSLTTAPVITARVFPSGDLDYYAFGAAAGPIRMTLSLPPESEGVYTALSLNLLDRDLRIVKTADPVINVNPSFGGNCPAGSSCRTTQAEVVLEYDNPSENQFYLIVSGAPGDAGPTSPASSSAFYRLTPSYAATGPVGTSVVSASFDNDTLRFEVLVSSFVRTQNISFSHARLRDHSLAVLPQTATNEAGTFLLPVSQTSAEGRVRGDLRLAPGFGARFPAVGTVHLEVFGVNRLGRVQSLGFSPQVNLTTNASGLTAFNNVFNPHRGEKATFKYEIPSPGNVSLRLYTTTGRHVLTLLDGFKPAGKGSVDWAGANLAGRTVASGIYLLHMEGPGVRQTRKVIVVK